MFEPPGSQEAPSLLASAWRFRWTTLLIVVLAGVVGYASTAFFPSTPRANATLSLVDPRGSDLLHQGGSTSDLSHYTANRARFATSARVLAQASKLMKNRYSARNLSTIVAATPGSAGVIQIGATAKTGKDAADVANAVTKAYVDLSTADTKAAAAAALKVIDARAQQISKVVAAQGNTSSPAGSAAAATLSALEIRASDISTYAALFDSGVDFVDPAQAPAVQVSGKGSKRNAAIGALLGLLIALAVAWTRAGRNRRIEDPEEPAEVLSAPLLGDIPDLRKSRTKSRLIDLTAMPAEPYQFASTGLRLAQPTGVILVVSADRQDGRTVTAANLAAAAARDGMRVALVDGDSRMRGLSRLIGVDPASAGLTDIVAGDTDLESCVIPVRVGDDALLSVIPAGQFHDDVPSDFRSRRMAATLALLRASHELVVIDSPPLLNAPEAAALAGHADGAVAVVRHGASLSRLDVLGQRLDLLPTRVLGYIVTRARRFSDVALREASAVDDSADSPASAR